MQSIYISEIHVDTWILEDSIVCDVFGRHQTTLCVSFDFLFLMNDIINFPKFLIPCSGHLCVSLVPFVL